ncbi:MAG: hypothetical protein HC844_14185 [Tabrizicola sp.]|nr:hypothetical protein [Tabrizicola sp.]
MISGEAPPNSQARLAAMAANVDDPCAPLSGRFDGYDPAFLAALDKAMAVLPKKRMQSARQWLQAINESDGGKVVRLPPADAPRTVTPMTRLTRLEADAGRKKIGPVILIGGVAALSLVAVGVYLAMPDSGTVNVARLPADRAAASASPAEPKWRHRWPLRPNPVSKRRPKHPPLTSSPLPPRSSRKRSQRPRFPHSLRIGGLRCRFPRSRES